MICVSKKKSYPKPENLKIFGQGKLNGIVEISGAKNSALVLLAASLLTNERIILHNVPRLTDIEKMANILRNLGVKIAEKNNKLEIDSQNISIKELPYELVNGLRASFFCIGPLLSKFGEASPNLLNSGPIQKKLALSPLTSSYGSSLIEIFCESISNLLFFSAILTPKFLRILAIFSISVRRGTL